MPSQLLTASRITAFLSCPRKHYWSYEVGLKRETDAHALRFGSAWHTAMEARWAGDDYETAMSLATGDASFEEIDMAKFAGLLAGYYARYGQVDNLIDELFAETEFRQPLPGSRTFDVAGKIDGLARLHDGRLALVEHKTCGESVEDGSDYWLRLRFNPQILQYVLAARAMGWNIEVILYDVTRKPAIKQKQKESVEEYADRLAADTQERPEFYFARREVPVLHDDMDEFSAQRIAVARSIRFCQRQTMDKPWHAWPRNMNMMTCKMCEFSSFCLQNTNPSPGEIPTGFIKGDKHAELETATEA